jgi:phage gpG-like protein
MARWGKTTAFKILGGEVQMRQPLDEIATTRVALERLKTKAVNVQPAFEACLPAMFWNEEQIFAAEGIPSWPALSPAYAAWKATRYPGKSILRRTDRLYDSLTSRTSETVWSVGPRSLRFGTRVPYWMVHQTGSRDGTVPARPPVVLLPETFRSVYIAVQQWLSDTGGFTPPVVRL